LKFLYAQKRLNEQLYNTHLECATLWPRTCQIIQAMIDEKLQQQMDTYYNHLNKKTRLSPTEANEEP
jgi:hypothetical protein